MTRSDFCTETEETQRIPATIGIGPVMRLGDVLDMQPGDPRAHFQDQMHQPTIAELHAHLQALLQNHPVDEQEKPRTFGPERPPGTDK